MLKLKNLDDHLDLLTWKLLHLWITDIIIKSNQNHVFNLAKKQRKQQINRSIL